MEVESNKLFPIATVTRSRGLSGELVAALNFRNIEKKKVSGVVWLGEDPDSLNPWDIEYFRVVKETAFLKLKTINSKKEADYLKGLQIYVTLDSEEDLIKSDIVGFQVKDIDTGNIVGEVTEVDHSSEQTLLIVYTGSKNVMIPGVNEFVKSVDYDNCIVFIRLIEGLIE